MLGRMLMMLGTGPLGVGALRLGRLWSVGLNGAPLLADSHTRRWAGSVSDLRKDYGQEALRDDDAPEAPLALFQQWFEEAVEADVLEPNAMCLSTVSEAGRPSARVVLLKGYDSEGFVWYTNYGSRKAQELDANPFAALTFWWGDLERSVRIEGRVQRISKEESEAYFRSRPRGSQIGALVSEQSRPIENRQALDARVAELKAKYEDEGVAVPMPDWGGFRLEPDRIEFWKGRSSRVHDRIVYVRSAGEGRAWTRQRLQP
eukprot:scaffold613_cov243-Pinguiococcus_pyrenoidosus.AAC.36